jgi:hypothetical protein
MKQEISPSAGSRGDRRAPAHDGLRAGGRGAARGLTEEVVWIFNTLLFLIGGFLVFFMAAGFAMLEGGLVRSKNVTMQMTKNVALFSLAAIMYWLIGYNLMYPLATGPSKATSRASSRPGACLSLCTSTTWASKRR